MKHCLLAFVLLANLLHGYAVDAAPGQRKRHRTTNPTTARTAQQVYICNGPNAKKWHRTESCAQGSCHSTVSRVPLSQARERMEGPCRKCM